MPKKKHDPLNERIVNYLGDPKIAQAMIDSADMLLRMRMGQLNSVADTMKKYCTIHQEGTGVDLEEPLYKVIELGELLECRVKYGTCDLAKDCWITRKGFCKRRKEDEK